MQQRYSHAIRSCNTAASLGILKYQVMKRNIARKSWIHIQLQVESYETRMWANAQRNGRPAKYRWRPLFNAAKFRWRPVLECRAVTLPRCETLWN